ncbi:hypothetical protein ABGB12_31255 [Actinocorallia sp. B10E7]|uniref:hypothetical protein n=1 Tax=Actinocorallia sp. B10E7 TaxID=3153558 RepID=UPI00325D1B2E
MTRPPKAPKTKRQALLPFGAGVVAAAAVCALVASLPDPRREAVRSGVSESPRKPSPEASPGTAARPPVTDVRVTVTGRTVRIHNRGPHGTGPITLDLRPREGRLHASCDRTGCSWPDLRSGESVEVRLRGRGRGRVEVHTTVPDRRPGDNEVRLLLRR